MTLVPCVSTYAGWGAMPTVSPFPAPTLDASQAVPCLGMSK
jgi:hypothetical protein